MVTFVPGKSLCTAGAIICAALCLVISTPFSLVACIPSITAPTVAFPRLEPIVFAKSATVIGFSSFLTLLSGNIISIIFVLLY